MAQRIQILFSVFICFTSLFAEDITKVLQNGLNGYTGCTDSYLYSIGAIPSSVNMNFGDDELLKTAN